MPLVKQLCDLYKVKKLYVFGSVLTEKFSPSSDIDLIVDFYPINLEDYADNYFDFKFSLQELFKRDIDLLEEKAIRNPYLKESLDREKQLIYG